MTALGALNICTAESLVAQFSRNDYREGLRNFNLFTIEIRVSSFDLSHFEEIHCTECERLTSKLGH